MSAKKQTRKTYGRRATGKTQTTISLSDEMLEKAKRNADADGRSLSNYIEQLLKSLPMLLLLAFAATGKAAVQQIQQLASHAR